MNFWIKDSEGELALPAFHVGIDETQSAVQLLKP
jgi:hypothetical protein